VEGNLRSGEGNSGQGYFHARRNSGVPHQGLDISGISGQTPVYANGNGTIETIGVAGQAGNRITINQGNGVVTLYAHLDSFAPGLQRGSRVTRGQQIGVVGQTGNAAGQAATEAHLHFGVLFDGTAQDPEPYLNGTAPCTPNPPQG
jgi:murein DD-endopeptidase MepM/ murein hydrolase activator NlpD